MIPALPITWESLSLLSPYAKLDKNLQLTSAAIHGSARDASHRRAADHVWARDRDNDREWERDREDVRLRTMQVAEVPPPPIVPAARCVIGGLGCAKQNSVPRT